MEVKEGKLKELSLKLLNRFFYNKTVYAEQVQLEDKKIVYKTKYKKIDAVKLKYGIQNKMAYMSYQQNQSNIKWICFDFDILKEKIGKDYDFFSSEYKEKLYDEVKLLTDKLNQLQIKYTLEYSGNRGVHVWVFFKEEITKNVGYTILNKIIQELNFKYINDEKGIALDKYPKNGNSEGNKIGSGVKIPVSYHKKSHRYSYLIENLEDIKKIEDIDEEFIEKQIKILDKCEENSVLDIIEKLEIDTLDDEESFDRKTGFLDKEYSLEEIKSMLKKSVIFQKIFSKDELSEKERTIIVSTLIRLQTKENAKYGEKLVYEFFEGRPDFNKEITLEKMNSLKYLYPLNISYLEKLDNVKCKYCEKNNITNAIELIDNVTIEQITSLQSKIKRSIWGEKNYLEYNDEVPLMFIKEDLNRIDEKEIEQKINKIKEGKSVDINYYKYIRKESDKEREMYSLDAEGRVLTTTAMLLIDEVIGGMYTNSNAYSYKLNKYGNKEKNEIFENWSILWGKYVSEIQDKITEEAYNDYYILKLDVHKFYQSITHEILKGQLYGTTNKLLQNVLTKNSKQKNLEYQNLCNFLINCINVEGMPQGPAYARYLAEIYISRIDDIINKYIEQDMEFYYRYVDDMVILVKNKERGNELLRIIDTSMKEINLVLNGLKMEAGYVKDIKDKIVTNDIEKYFVDNIEEDMPSYLIKKAVKILRNMLNEIKDKDDFSYKNIPFFLTHLIDEKLIKNNLEKIKKNIISSDEGRGSMFKHFYRNIIFKHNVDLDFYKDIKGLSRANFINELLVNLDKIKKMEEEEKDTVKDIVTYYLGLEDICDYEKIELYAIALENEVDVVDVEQDLFTKAIKCVHKIKPSEKTFESILDNIQRQKDKTQNLVHAEEILSKLEKVPEYDDLVKTIYSCLLDFNTQSIEAIQPMYNLICFITLFWHNKKLDIGNIWKKFEELFTEEQMDKIKEAEWLKYNKILDKSKFKENNIIRYLIEILGERVERTNIIVEKNYAVSLLMYLRMNNISFKKSKDLEKQLDEEVDKMVREKNMKIFQWTKIPGVEYFPNKDMAIKNMEFNNRIMLYDGNTNKMLVRGDEKIFDDEFKDALKQEGLNITGEPKYYAIIECKDEMSDLYNKIKDKNIFDVLQLTCDIIKKLDREKLVNIFEKGTLYDKNNEIYFKFSKEDKQIIVPISKDDTSKGYYTELKNNFKGLCQGVVETLKRLDSTSQFKVSDQIIYTSQNIDEMLIPGKIKDQYMEKIEYLMEFVGKLKEVKKEDKLDAKIIETAKIKTLITSKNERLKVENGELSKEYNLIKNYNKIGVKAVESKILYGKVEVKLENLKEAIQTIIDSIHLNGVAPEEVTLITNKLGEDLKEIEEKYQTKVEELKFKQQLEDEENEDWLEDKKVIIFGSTISEGETKAGIMDEHEYYFEKDDVIVVLPNYLEKAIEYIRKRKGEFEENETKKYCNLPCYEEAVKNIKKQNDITEEEAKEKLNKFLKKQKDTKYNPVLINAIAHYRIMDETEMKAFIKIVKKYLDDEEKYVTISLNDLDEDPENGTWDILKVKGPYEFGRGRDYIKKLKDNQKSIQDASIKLNGKKLVIVSDIGLSGSQFRNKVKIGKKNEDYEIYKNYKKYIQEADEVILVNCIYTDQYEKKVRTLLKGKRVAFEGKKIEYEKFLQKNIFNLKEKKMFKECLETCDSLDKKMPASEDNFGEYIKHIEEVDTKYAFIARYKTMPKYHYLIFDDEIFVYKPEE